MSKLPNILFPPHLLSHCGQYDFSLNANYEIIQMCVMDFINFLPTDAIVGIIDIISPNGD